MESKNVKVIDEHNIDRDANVVCAFKMDDKDYVLYWIERDEENANLFVSKLLKNNDNTSNMMNIEDTMEKNKVNDVVKELVTLAIKNENDKSQSELELGDGVKVSFNGVGFNREQNINVTKTYVTTVKKSVAKVSEDYYYVENVSPSVENKVDEIFTDIKPVEENKEAPLEEQAATVEPLPVVEDTPAIPVEVVDSLASDVAKEPAEEVKIETPEPVVEPVSTPVQEPVTDVEKKEEENTQVVKPEFEVKPNFQLEEVKEEKAEEVIPTISAIPSTPEPVKVENETPAVPEVAVTEETKAEDNVLVFNASKETNFNKAINEESTQNIVETNDVVSLRQFGQSDNANTAVESNGKSRGFAKFKVIAVIGIIVFMVSCVFMGYEVFNYIQAVK